MMLYRLNTITEERYAGGYPPTVYLMPKVYRALKVKAATTDRPVSDVVNAAVLESLREDALDLEAFDRRAKDPTRPLEQVIQKLKCDGTYDAVPLVKAVKIAKLRSHPA